MLVPILGMCLCGLIRRFDTHIPGWRWFVNLLAGLCLLYGTFQCKEILETPCLTDIATRAGIVHQFLSMLLLSWLATLVLETEIIQLLWNVLSSREYQWKSLSFWKWVCLAGLVLTSSNACVVMINLSQNAYGSIINITKDPNVLMYFAMAVVAKTLRVLLQGKKVLHV